MLTQSELKQSRESSVPWEKIAHRRISPIDCLIPIYLPLPDSSQVASVTMGKTRTPITLDSGSGIHDVILLVSLYSTGIEAEAAGATLSQWNAYPVETGRLASGDHAVLFSMPYDQYQLTLGARVGAHVNSFPHPNDGLHYLVTDHRRQDVRSPIVFSAEIRHRDLVVALSNEAWSQPRDAQGRADAIAEGLHGDIGSGRVLRALQARISGHVEAAVPVALVSCEDIRERIEDIAVDLDLPDFDLNVETVRSMIERAIGRLDPGGMIDHLIEMVAQDLISGALSA